MSAETIPAATGAWPQGCIKRSSCARNKACMYGWNGSCQHLQRDIRAEVDAASVARSTRPAEPAPEVEVGEVVAWLRPDWQDPATYTGLSPVTVYRMPEWWPLVRLSTLEAERARADAAERDAYQCGGKLADMEMRAETAEAALSRALQDRDEAVRVAEALTYALTPSADTKALMIAEFFEEIEVPNPEYQGESDDPEDDDDEPEFVAHRVPIQWGTIKHMMATLREFARLRADQPAGEGGEA